MTRRVSTTACPRNCYSTCGMRVEVEDGRICRIEANPDNRATPEGVCLKGLAYVERQTAADRILHPLRRTADGGFEKVSWDSALDQIATRLELLRSRPRAVMVYTASGTKGLLNAVTGDFWRLYGGCTTTYGDLCWPAGLEATRLTLGDNRHSAPWDLANARLIVLWGKNAAETNIHQMRFIEQAIIKGARLVVIDPRRTQSAEAADLLLQPVPGSDGALALGLAQQLVELGLVNLSFVDRHVLGFEPFRELLAEYPPHRVAEICGVPAATITRLARWIGTVEPMSICAGFGMQRYTNSGQTMRAIIALLALTGNIGQPGAGWIYANLQSQVFGSPRDPLAFYPPEADDDPVRVSVSTARLGRDMLAQRNPELEMIWVERANPLTQNPETTKVREAFRALDFRVVVDLFLTDTAREADLVLPAKTIFEQTDVINAYWHHYLQLKQKILQPPAGVKPETEVYHLLARRLGFDDSGVDQLIPGPGDQEVEAYLERRLASLPGVNLEALRRGPVLAPGAEEVAWADLDFSTPSGKIELLCGEAVTRWGCDALPSFQPPRESLLRSRSGGAKLHLLTPNTKNRIHSQFNNLPSIRELDDRARIHLSPVDAQARGIDHGAWVMVVNDRGSLRLEAALDHSLRPGCVWITNGWWSAEGGTVNLLSAARETDLGHGAAFHDNLVEVRPA